MVATGLCFGAAIAVVLQDAAALRVDTTSDRPSQPVKRVELEHYIGGNLVAVDRPRGDSGPFRDLVNSRLRLSGVEQRNDGIQDGVLITPTTSDAPICRHCLATITGPPPILLHIGKLA